MPSSTCQGYKKSSCQQPLLADGLCATCRGSQFEDQVAGIFELLGFTVHRDSLLDGRQVDLILTYHQNILTLRALVECKFHKTKLAGVSEISQVVATSAPSLRARSIDRIYFITTTGFTAQAKANAHENGIECLTYAELSGKLIDFRPYLRRIVANFEEDPLWKQYVDLKIARLAPRPTVAKPYSSTWFPVRTSLMPYSKRWLRSRQPSHILLVGDFGSGKTSFCRYFNYVCAKRHLADPARNPRVPLLIRLGQHARLETGSVQTLITDFLVNECQISTNYQIFYRLLEKGHLFLLLDGFDEMAMQVDRGTRIRNLELLSELFANSNKVVLTGRPAYFPSLQEMRGLFREVRKPASAYEEVSAELASSLQRSPPFQLLQLQPFSTKQIDRFLRQSSLSHEGSSGCSDFRDILRKSYDLQDLASRPVLLDIILKSVPQLLHLVEEIDLGKLYSIYTEFWLDRDWKKGEMRQLLTREQRTLFMEEIALQMHAEGTTRIHYDRLSKEILSYFGLQSAARLDYFEHDIRTCSFLTRDDHGNYRFTHKSFLEFFAARGLGRRVLENRVSLLMTTWLGEEVIQFLVLSTTKELLESLRARCGRGGAVENANILRILARASQGRVSGLDLRNLNLEGAHLQAVCFEGCKMVGADFSGAGLFNVEFEDCDLSGVAFRGGILSGVAFRNCSLRKVDFRRSSVQPSYSLQLPGPSRERVRFFKGGAISFDSCDLSGSNLRGRRFVRSRFTDCSFRRVNLQNATFMECIFSGSRFVGGQLGNVWFYQCCFEGAEFLNSYMRRVKFIAGNARFDGSGSPVSRTLGVDSSVFTGSTFGDCDLRGAVFIRQLVKGAGLSGGRWSGARMIGTTLVECSLQDVDWSEAVLVGSRSVGCRVHGEFSPPTNLLRSEMILAGGKDPG